MLISVGLIPKTVRFEINSQECKSLSSFAMIYVLYVMFIVGNRSWIDLMWEIFNSGNFVL